MKHVIFSVLLAWALPALAQNKPEDVSLVSQQGDSPYKYWKLENKAVTFDAVYEVPGVNHEHLKERLISYISGVKGLGEIRENSTGLTAVMSSYECDFRKMGYNRLTAPIFISQKISGMVSVLVKDEKYRVLISNIVSNKTDDLIDKRHSYTNSELEIVILKWNKSGWATAKNKVDVNKQLEEDFYQSFLLKESKSEW